MELNVGKELATLKRLPVPDLRAKYAVSFRQACVICLALIARVANWVQETRRAKRWLGVVGGKWRRSWRRRASVSRGGGADASGELGFHANCGNSPSTWLTATA